MSETESLLACRNREDKEKLLADLFMRHRERLRLMVKLRLDPRLHGRLDPSDVLQEAFMEVFRRLDDFLEAPPMTVFLWLRRITGQKVLALHRHHLGVKERDVRREVSLQHDLPGASTVMLAAHLVHGGASPSRAAARSETRKRLEEALEGMDPLDREVIALRHFEGLSNGEVAATLELDKSAA